MLSRLALRAAVCETLAPTGATAFPTIARACVYDSRIDPIDGLDEIEAVPMAVVYCEEHDSAPFSGTQGVDRQSITLVIELLIATRGDVEVTMDDGTTAVVGAGMPHPTDAEREALLDLLEAEVRRALDLREMRAGSDLLNAVGWFPVSMQSIPLRDADRTVRLAQRSLQIAAQIHGDCWPEPGEARGSGLDALPEPLRAVAKALPVASPHRAIAETFAARIAAPTTLLAHQGLTIRANIDRGETMPTDDEHDVAATFDNP
mgnify:CR=1 FL=1|jgi:hypothetical protein